MSKQLTLDRAEKAIQKSITIDRSDIIIGIYFLFKDYKIVYIGQSIDCVGRIHSHFRAGCKDFDYGVFMPCERDLLTKTESLLIDHYQPKYNIHFKRITKGKCLV